MPDLTGRIAIVTGASRRIGIGAAIARALAAAGADVCFTHYAPYDDEMTWGRDADGPAAIWVSHNHQPQEHLAITTPAEEEQSVRALYKGYHLLIDGAIYTSRKLPANTANDILVPVSLLPGTHTARICYVLSVDDQSTTRLSPEAEFEVT